MLFNGQGQFLGKINFSGTGTVKLNGATYTVINSMTDLANLFTPTVTGNYVLGSNIDNGGESTPPAPSAHLTAISTVSAIRPTFG